MKLFITMSLIFGLTMISCGKNNQKEYGAGSDSKPSINSTDMTLESDTSDTLNTARPITADTINNQNVDPATTPR